MPSVRCVQVYLSSLSLQQLELSVIKSRSERKHLWQLEVRGLQTADGVSGVTETQRCIHSLQRHVY